jgi:hypothetical protein
MTSPCNLLFFFGLAYFSQGLAGTLIQQPLAYHLKSDGMAANHVAQALAFVAIPWLVKPLYGLISDSIPLLGYRRKSYLVLATSLSTFGYLVVSQLAAPWMCWSMHSWSRRVSRLDSSDSFRGNNGPG